MTPEKARELRDLSSPGPWIIGRHKYADAHRIYDRRGNLIAWGARGFNADLMAAARDLARIVAGLRYEYAVQNTETGAFLREESDGAVISTSDPAAADWDMTSEEADSYAAWMTGEELVEYRVVRRLVGSPEVVE